MSISPDALDSSDADADGRHAALIRELDALEDEAAYLLRERVAAEHPDVAEDAADQAEDLIEQETADALLEAVAFRKTKLAHELASPGGEQQSEQA